MKNNCALVIKRIVDQLVRAEIAAAKLDSHLTEEDKPIMEQLSLARAQYNRMLDEFGQREQQ